MLNYNLIYFVFSFITNFTFLIKIRIANTAITTDAVMVIKAGIYDPHSVILPINQFIIITEKAATVPANPAKVPTDGPLNRSLDNV